MPVTCLEELPECRLGQLGPLLVTVWYEARTERALEAIQRGFASVNAQHPKVTIASVVRGAVGDPTDALGKQFAAFRAATADRCCGIVHLVVPLSSLERVRANNIGARVSLFTAGPNAMTRDFKSFAEQLQALPGQATEVRADLSLRAQLEAFAGLAAPSSR